VKIAGYFHEIDNWCPPEVYPLHIRRLDAVEARDLLREGFACSSVFEARAIIMGLPEPNCIGTRPIEDGEELLLMRDWPGPPGKWVDRFWWLVTRAVKLP